MDHCILCGHQQQDHSGDGCRGRSRLVSACDCSWIVPQPLDTGADAEAHRARSDWWDQQARASWDLALRSGHDLDRWYPLARFHRIARRAEIDHRRYADSLERPSFLEVTPVTEPAPYAVAPVAQPEPAMPLARRLELAAIA